MGNKRSVYIYIYVFDQVGQMGWKTTNLNHTQPKASWPMWKQNKNEEPN